MVFHALPRMLVALAGAKRLECGSLLPLCLYAHTTCLSPYLHPRGSSEDFGSRRLEQGAICRPRRNQGTKPKQRACHLIQLTPKGRTIVTALLAARKADTEQLTNSWHENLRKYKWLSNITKYSVSLASLPKSCLVGSTACGLEIEILLSGRRFP